MDEEKKVEAAEEEQPPTPGGDAGSADERDQMKRYVKMPARYEGRCKSCGTKIRIGDPMVWDTKEKKAYCAEDGLEYMMEQGVDEEDD